MNPFSLNISGKLKVYDRPLVMAIVNVTPDSFYDKSRCNDNESFVKRIDSVLEEGADIIDIGACSTRPDSVEVTEAEEIDRLGNSLSYIRDLETDVLISVDTFRSSVARFAVEEFGVNIINDVYGGSDENMFSTVAELKVPYVLTHCRGNSSSMTLMTDYADVTAEVLKELDEKLQLIELAGVNDVIVDPGIGFAKTVKQNFELIKNLEAFKVLHRPVLVGLSRKSLITKTLSIDISESLEATTALNALSLDRGASILRVHDVTAAKHCVAMYTNLIA